MTKEPNLENLLKAITDSVPAKNKSLIETYLQNPDALSDVNKDYAERVLIKKYPSLFKKTKKRSFKQKIFIGIACVALGFGLSYFYSMLPLGKTVRFDKKEAVITCYPGKITFETRNHPDVAVLEDFYNYQKSIGKLDHDKFVRDLYMLDSHDCVDGRIWHEPIETYLSKELTSK